jgi:SAM-dependent MidA family methyltransferase
MEIREKINYLIQKNGYISIDAFMSISMTSETNSYYRSKDPINKDFITSPEISQIFGEMIGIWVIDAWNKLGCPKNVSLVEFGSGRGTLLRDLLKIAKLEKSFYEALNISIIDINEVLIDIQKETLKGYNNIKWVTSINEVPKFPTIIIANEFFDALPIKQYQKKRK